MLNQEKMEKQELILAEEKRAKVKELLQRIANQTYEIYPMSYGQKSLWFLYESAKHSSAYNIIFSIKVFQALDEVLLHRAVQKIVERHEILRTTYTQKEGKPFQIVKNSQRLDIEVVDAQEDDENRLKERIKDFNRQIFDLVNGPVMRIALFKRSINESVLAFSVHHIACDFFSFMILVEELFRVYFNLCSGSQIPLSKEVRQYNDYIKWQYSLINSQKGEQLLEYWKKEMGGDLPVLELAVNKQRPPIQTFHGNSIPFEINKELSGRLKEIAQQKGVTMFTLLLAAFHVFLYRYTMQDEVIVGIPLSGRSNDELKSVVGYLINMLPIRGRLAGNPSFEDFLKQIKDKVIGAIEHGEYPFPLLVEHLQPKRDPGRSPVFQTTFELLKYQKDLQNDTMKELKIEPFDIPQQEGQFDIMLAVNELPESFIGVFLFNTDLFETSTIERMISSFLILLDGTSENPGQRIDELPMLSEWDKQKLLKEWNNTSRQFAQDSFVHRLFEKQVTANPNALAVSAYDGRLTYDELNRKSNQLAHYLYSLGIGPDKKIGICMNPSKYMVIALLGVLKSGATYVPIDPGYPEKRIEYIIEDADVEIILSAERIEIPQNTEKTVRINIDACEDVLLIQSDSNPDVLISPQNIAYILYTSGSTGTPKGVEVYHVGMMNYLLWCAQEYIKPNDDAGMPASFAYLPLVFDASITSLYTPLITGRYLLIPQKQGLEIFDDPDIQKGGFSFVKLTPAHLSLLKESLTKGKLNGFTKRVIIGGEALLSEQLAYFRKCGLDWTIINEYGPTETVVGSTVYSFPVKDEVPRNVPIGKPIMNTNIFIIDSQNQLVPAGVIGEIAIGGIGVSKGYVNREDLTREKYIANSFIKGENKYIYKTGDLGRWLPDGNLEYIGRVDHQVKVRGYRIELGEIEAVLAGSPGVSAAAVVVQEMKAGDRQLVAYYAADRKQAGAAQEIMDYLKGRLPSYMIPATLIELDEIPLTRNGKVDRLLLSTKAGQKTGGTCRNEVTCPLEEELVGLWKQILNVEHVGIDDGFSQLGGHSLLAVQLISKIRQKFEKNVPVMELYPNGTVRRIAGLLDNGGTNIKKKSSPVLIKKGNNASKNIFLIHPGTGSIDMYPALCDMLDNEFNCWGIPADIHRLSTDKSMDIGKLACEYLEMIKGIQGDGYYYIAGWCIGGTIAFEMMRRLEQQRHKHGTLLLISSAAPTEDMTKLTRELAGLDTLLEAIKEGKVNVEQALSVLPDNLQWAVAVNGIQTADKLVEYFEFYKNLHEIRMGYTPESNIETSIHYLNPENTVIDPGKWQRFCNGNLIVHSVTGEHDTLFQEPHVPVLADTINSILKPDTHSDIKRCTKCTLPETFPNITFDDEGVCNYCNQYHERAAKKIKYKVETEDELIKNLQKFKRKGSRYDVLIPLSGGVDSSMTLIKIVEKYNLKVLAFHNDHGYEDDTATENVKKLCKAMNVDLIIKQQDLGFMKKLWKYTHEAKSRGLSACFVCGGIIYANSLEIADCYNIPMVINGYSKGQADMMADKENALEAWTGLLEEFQKDPDFFKEFMEKQEPMKKQIVFKNKQDFKNDLPNRKMLVIPFYLFDFYKTDKEKLKSECIKRFDWKPIKYTYPSRTTNCTMVWLNTHVDICKIGYTMYDEEYAGIVRAGDMSRAQAISDLIFNPPEGLVEKLAQEIGTDLSKCKIIKK